MVEYENRYGDVFTFTKLENGNVLWEGTFEHIRIGFPNVYKKAYQQFLKDGGELNQYDFEEKVHEQLYDEEGNWIKAGPITEKYSKLVYSDHDNINMVDPSGGPYIKAHSDLGTFGKELKGLCVRSFIWNKEKKAYEIQTYGEFDHLTDSKLIGGLSV
tara:strand:+ start:1809 stop:2282 length:474 start_codon:yes stop_codon:yes gene_type:complete